MSVIEEGMSPKDRGAVYQRPGVVGVHCRTFITDVTQEAQFGVQCRRGRGAVRRSTCTAIGEIYHALVCSGTVDGGGLEQQQKQRSLQQSGGGGGHAMLFSESEESDLM